jgi:hypothetical protein
MHLIERGCFRNTRWFKYDRDKLVTCLHTNSPGHIWTTLYNYLVKISTTCTSGGVAKCLVPGKCNAILACNRYSFVHSFIHSFIHSSVMCHTTGPQPLPKRFLHLMRSRASSFKWEYPLLSPRSSSNCFRLLVTSIRPFIFPSITCFRRQFLLKMWPIQLAFPFLISCRIFLYSLTLSNTSSFLTWWVQLIFSILLQHHKFPGVGVNIFSSCRLKLDALHSSHLESFILVVAIAWHGNACPSLGCPTRTGSNKTSYYLLAAQSATPQLPGLNICSTGGLRNIFFPANLECWHRFLSCGLHEEEVLKGACFHYVVKLPSN